MIVTLDIETVFSWIGTAVCIIIPALIALVIYANFRIVRRGDGAGEEGKWKP